MNRDFLRDRLSALATANPNIEFVAHMHANKHPVAVGEYGEFARLNPTVTGVVVVVWWRLAPPPCRGYCRRSEERANQRSMGRGWWGELD